MRRAIAGRIIGSWVAGLAVVAASVLPGNQQGIAQEKPGDLSPNREPTLPDINAVPRARTQPPAPAASLRGVSIRGRVVDDETGRPIEAFGLQPRQDTSRGPTQSAWYGSIRTIPNSASLRGGKWVDTPNPGGDFDPGIISRGSHGGPADGFRVLADGYEPTPVDAIRPDPNDAGKTYEMVVRMKRGRAVVGRVVDHLGRPASGAKLYLLRPDAGQVTIRDDVIGAGSDVGLIDPSVTRATADADGRFRITGVGDADTIGISAPTLHHWVVPMPGPGQEASIRLPEPATIRFRVGLDGDAPEAKFALYLMEAGAPPDRLRVERTFTIENPGDVVVRDASPGSFYLFRSKVIAGSGETRSFTIERRAMTIESGQAQDADYVRDRGRPVVGRVGLPEGERPRVLYVGLQPSLRGPRGGRIPSDPPFLDIVACDPEGNFRTARIPPGDYTAQVAGYLVRARYGPFHMMDGPDFRGEIPLTVPADGEPPAPPTIIESQRIHRTVVPAEGVPARGR